MLTHAAPAVLVGGTHADTFVAPAVTATSGAGSVPNIDYDQTNLGPSNLIPNSANTGYAFKSVASGATVNHAPYAVISASYCCYMASYDLTYYASLQGIQGIFSSPLAIKVGGALPLGTPPPVSFISSSSQNSTNGGSGWGIEFGLSASYLGLNTSEDSWVTAQLAGFAAALKVNHPTWNWFDIKAALRQTGGQWATGYNFSAFGYGFVNWPAANSLTGTGPGVMWLQPPGMYVTNNGFYAAITLLPFRQTRRVNEQIYSVSAAYSWPVKNEYTASDIAASGATLLYTSNGTDMTPVFNFVASVTGSITFVAFTLDGAGEFSRVEAFSKVTQALTVGSMCYH